MLVIRPQQLQHFETVIFDRFVDNCVTHVQDHHPRVPANRAAIVQSINRAIYLDFRDYNHIVKFLDWECWFGDKFYETEKWAWCKAILNNGLHPSIRIHRIEVRLEILRNKGAL